MKKINNLDTNFKQMSNNIKYIMELEELNEDSYKELMELEEDGFYGVLDEQEFNKVPFEERWYTKYVPTYHVSVLLLKYYNQGHYEILNELLNCLQASLSKDYQGHGYDAQTVQLHYLTELYRNNVITILESKQNLKTQFDKYEYYYRERIAKEAFNDGWGSIENQMKEYISLIDSHLIFTYGTLMKGNRNHHYLKEAKYIDDGILNHYVLVEVSTYPGAIPFKNNTVHGEIYKVTDQEKKAIDLLEGNQYTSKKVWIVSNEQAYYCSFYELNEPGKHKASYIKNRKWFYIDPDQYVWYACYGSNICDYRFQQYIMNTSSKEQPIASKNIIMSHPIYFAKNSSRWQGKGVAFLDIENKGITYGVMNLISKRQFDEIHRLEGPLWYDQVYKVSTDEQGIDILTLTHSTKLPISQPSKEYIEVIGNGIKNHYEDDDLSIVEYLQCEKSIYDFSDNHIKQIIDNLCNY